MPFKNMYFLTPDYESGGAGLLTTADDYIKFATALASQLSTDKEITDIVAINPDAATEFKDDEVNEAAQDAANEIIEKVEQYELENGMIKVIDPNNPEEDKENDGKNENGTPNGSSSPIR